MSKKVDWEVDETITLKEDYDMSQLPDSPCCKNLLKLSIQVSGFTEIPPTFFEHMPLLEELDLSTTNIQSLPSSISSLTLLQKLFLRGCSVLMELPSEIGMLTKLKLLDCEGSEIMYIPKEIGELNELEVLRVSLSQYADYYLKTKRVNDPIIIPRYILSKLNKLKELCITTCPEAEWWEEEVKEIQDDLCHLEYLETLKWYLPTKMLLDQFLQINREGKKIYENLSNFTLTIGRHPQLTSCLPANLEKKFEKFEKCLKWINAEGNEKDISMIMERAEALFLSRHWTIVRLSDFHLAKLKYCLLAECNEMETLVKVDELSENFGNVGLESIEYLTVHDMEKFQCIWNGPMGKDSLLRLRILALHACPKLTTIFTINIAQNLSCLTELTIEDCPNVTSLISDESPNIATTGPLIPCLEKIFLLDLPNLDSTFRGKIILEKVDSLLVYNCLKLQYLSVTELPNIQKIKGEREWWNDLKCDKSRWQNVFEQLKEERKLIEQLAEATNSLQRFHDILSRDAKGKKPLDRFSLGVLETKGHTSNFPIGEQEGLPLSQPDAKDENPLDRFTFGVTPTKGQSSNFPIREQEGLSLSQQAAKDEKLLDRSALGVSEIKSDKSIFHLEEQEGVSSRNVSTDGNKNGNSSGSKASSTPRSEGEILQSANLKSFNYSNLRNATRNFRPDSVLGLGGFGSVFKGWIDEQSFTAAKPGSGVVIAVKRLDQESFQGHREWLAEVNYLGQFSHPNLVKLIGYCLEDEHRLLVYEFMPRGSLENHLFGRGSYFQPLSWSLRLKVALGAARGLAFLHSAEANVIYRDFKTSKVLLDSEYNAKLSDFGLAKDGPTGDKSHVSTRVIGTYGYAAPEYIATGHLTTKNDVYSFGVVLLEMLSSRRAVDRNRPSGEHSLVEWAKPYLPHKRKIFHVLDNRLEGQYTLDGAHATAKIALRCVSMDPRFRPNMDEVVKELELLQDPKGMARLRRHSANEAQGRKLVGSRWRCF